MIRVILVDDEEPALQRLGRMIGQHTDLRIVGRFTKPSEALAAVDELQPDAAFLDIDMPGMSGLDLAVLLMERQPRMETVMVTAFNEFAVQAFEVNAIDYLLKPAGAEQLKRCEERLARRLGILGRAAARREASVNSQARMVCLGGFESFAPGRREPLRFATAKAEELFAFLLANRDADISKWTLCEQIWPGHDPDKAEQNLHSTVFRLKKTCLEAGFPLDIVSRRGHYRFSLPDDCHCDLREFENVADECVRMTGNSASEARNAAIAAYKGQLFAGKPYPWAEALRQGLERRFAALAKRQAEDLEAGGEGSRAVDTLLKLTNAVPYDEEGHEALLAMYLRTNNRPAFVLHYERVAKLFRDALGLEPGDSLRRLHEEMKRTLI